jgi:hypothetical protein
MHNQKRILLGIFVVLLGAAAFIGARFLHPRSDAIGMGAPFEGDFRSMIVPAPELPATAPAVTGPFVDRQDNIIIVETKSLEAGGIGEVSSEHAKRQTDPRVEVFVSGKTAIYRETTNPSKPLSAENQTVVQTVETGKLDDLDSRAMVMVWGRKSGDRVIADLLLFSDLVAVKSAIFEDCEICP